MTRNQVIGQNTLNIIQVTLTRSKETITFCQVTITGMTVYDYINVCRLM